METVAKLLDVDIEWVRLYSIGLDNADKSRGRKLRKGMRTKKEH